MKEILFDEELRKKLCNGVEQLYKAVSSTLGPSGRFAAIPGYGAPVITKDGVSVAKEVELKDPFENIGAQIIKEVSARTNDVVGDGTTTSTVVARSLVKEGLKIVATDCQPIEIKKGMDKATEIVIDFIKKEAVKVKEKKEIEAVATISANNDKAIGEMIATAFEKVGVDGIVNVEETKGVENSVTFTDGIMFDEGYLSPYFINNRTRGEIEFEDAYVVATDKKINSSEEIVELLNIAASRNKPIVFVCESLEGEALNVVILNVLNGALKAAAVKVPGYGHSKKENLEDIAIMTGATPILEDTGIKLSSCGENYLGTVKTIKIKKHETIFVNGGGKQEYIKNHVDNLKTQIKELSSPKDIEKMKKRISKFSGSAATITVGGATKAETGEIKYRVEDAVAATKAALEEGIVAGGGYTLLRASEYLEKKINDDLFPTEDMKNGAKIFVKALKAPLMKIAENAGYNGGAVLQKCIDGKVGFNALTGEYMDMLNNGIIDPAKVTVACVKNANSGAGVLLTTNVAIVKAEEVEKE